MINNKILISAALVGCLALNLTEAKELPEPLPLERITNPVSGTWAYKVGWRVYNTKLQQVCVITYNTCIHIKSGKPKLSFNGSKVYDYDPEGLGPMIGVINAK